MGREVFLFRLAHIFFKAWFKARNRISLGPFVSSESTNCLCTSTSGDFVRWESSSEGSNRRCKSLAAKALSAAANSIETLITISIRFTL